MTDHCLIDGIFYPPSMESPFECLFLQTKHSKAIATRTRMTITPITMPAMAPPDSPPSVSKVRIHTNTADKHSYKYSWHWQYLGQQHIHSFLTPPPQKKKTIICAVYQFFTLLLHSIEIFIFFYFFFLISHWNLDSEYL